MTVLSRYHRRLLVNRFNLAMSLATMALGMLFLFWILAVLFANGGPIDIEHLPQPSSEVPIEEAPISGSLPDQVEHLERRRILDALDRAGGNQRVAAELLGISRRTLISRLDAYQLPRPKKGKV